MKFEYNKKNSRCLDIAEGNHFLDTSSSTQFHSACLYWQHPSIPGLSLYPRFILGWDRISGSAGIIRPDIRHPARKARSNPNTHKFIQGT